MKPADIDRIANAVVGGLAGREAGLLGCGAISSTEAYGCPAEYACDPYECGGQGEFSCSNDFVCHTLFDCPPPQAFSAMECWSEWFYCEGDYICGRGIQFAA